MEPRRIPNSQQAAAAKTKLLQARLDRIERGSASTGSLTAHSSTHAAGGSDPLTPGMIGSYTSTEVDALIAAIPGGGGGGNVLLSGSGAPSSGLGSNGDVYIDSVAYDLYGPKAASAWGSGISLIGSAGADGNDGAPGAPGADGIDGADGAPGAPGAPGADGADGADGGAASRSTLTQAVTAAAGAEVSVDLTLAKSFALYKVTATKACRIRLYATAADRTADASRITQVAPQPDAGLITEIILDGSMLSLPINPPQLGSNLETVPSSTIKALIANNGSSADLSLTFTWLGLET